LGNNAKRKLTLVVKQAGRSIAAINSNPKHSPLKLSPNSLTKKLSEDE